MAFYAADERSDSEDVVVPTALHSQLRRECQFRLERTSDGNGRGLVFSVRHANVCTQSFVHLPTLEMEESRTDLGHFLFIRFPRSIRDSFRHQSGLDANYDHPQIVKFINK